MRVIKINGINAIELIHDNILYVFCEMATFNWKLKTIFQLFI